MRYAWIAFEAFSLLVVSTSVTAIVMGLYVLVSF